MDRATERRLLYAVFTLSGAAALVLEVVWTRWLVLAMGASTLAVTLSLAVFMAGIGLGALAAGRMGDARPARVLAAFAAVEGGIALWAFASIPLAGSWLPGFAAFLARSAGAPALPLPLRGALAAMVLLPPTLLMGASLPLLVRWAVSARLLPARSVGALYAANTLGGAAGTLLAVFVLVDRLGLSATAAVAGGADALVAAAALVVFLRRRAARGEEGQGDAAAEPAAAPGPPPPAGEPLGSFGVAALAYFVSGFVGLGLEVISHRVLHALVESSVYAFGVMLAAFLTGIAAGSLAAARVADRVRAPVAWLGLTLGALSLGVGGAKRVFASWHLPGTPSPFSPSFLASPWSYGLELAGCFAALLPAALALGFAVPLVARVAAGIPARIAGRFGSAYALNTCGAVAGSLVSGLVLAPRLGTGLALDLLAAVAGGTGLLLVVAGARPSARFRFAAAATSLLAAGLALGWGLDPVRRAVRGWSPNGELLEFREGPVQAVAVVREANDLQLDFLRIVADQTSFASTNLRSRRYMSLLGHLPALWGRPPRRALVICFGTGITAGAVATHPRLDRLDVAELSPEVISLAGRFREASGDVLANPRVRLHVEDGRHVALAAREPWDLITLEPPPPRDSGVVSLYSADFYRLCRKRLSPGGVVAQWCPLESQSQDEVRAIVRTFAAAFPHVLAFLPVEHDLLLLGSEAPLAADPAELARRMAPPAVRASLAAIGFLEPADLLAAAIAGRPALERFAGDAPIVTDDRPSLEYFARFGRRVVRPDPAALLTEVPALDALAATPADAAVRRRFDRSREALFASLRAGWSRAARTGEDWMEMAARAADVRPDDPFYLWAAALSDEHLARLGAGAERAGGDPGLWLALGVREARRGRERPAIRALARTLELAPEQPDALFTLGALLVRRDPSSDAGRDLLRRFLRVAPGAPAAATARTLLAP